VSPVALTPDRFDGGGKLSEGSIVGDKSTCRNVGSSTLDAIDYRLFSIKVAIDRFGGQEGTAATRLARQLAEAFLGLCSHPNGHGR